MKTMRYMIAAATISAALFTGCSKDNSLESNLTGTTANNNKANATNATADMPPISGNAAITLQLQTLLPPSTMIRWTGGTINASEDLINVSKMEGNMVEKFTFGGKSANTYELLGTTTLGIVDVPYYGYLGMEAEILLNPLNGANSLLLTGSFGANPGSSAMPLTVAIDQAFTLNSIWISNTAINQPAYTAMLTLDMSQITNGITTTMLENAQVTNGTIVISVNSNPNLYGIIVQNLQDISMNLQLSGQATQPNPIMIMPALPQPIARGGNSPL